MAYLQRVKRRNEICALNGSSVGRGTRLARSPRHDDSKQVTSSIVPIIVSAGLAARQEQRHEER